MKQVVHAACPHDCPDACGVLITIDGDKAVKIQGDPAHPVTRGFLCAKVAKYLDRVYSPGRVLYPMRRVGPKGPNPVAPIFSSAPGSDRHVRATQAVHERLRAVAAAGAAVLLYSSDVDEVLALSNRLLVMHAGVVRSVGFDREEVGRAMLGVA